MNKIVLNFLPDPMENDFEAICRVMCPQNLIETELFVIILKKASKKFFDDVVQFSEYLLSVTFTFARPSENETSIEELHFLNEILYRTPINSTAFMNALLARIVYFVQAQKYPMARSDIIYYKSFDLNLMTIDGIVLVQTLMCSCLYFMRDMNGARCALDQLEEFLDMLPVEMFHNKELHSYLQDLENYKNEIKESTNNVNFKIKRDCDIQVPINEFKADREIPFASSACEFVSQTKGITGVYARTSIAKGEVVISEKPHLFQFSAPFMNCSVCAAHRDHLYTCSNCRYVSYCSWTCIKSDLEHKFECYGYKIGLIPMLESTLLIRSFLQAAQFLSPAIVNFTQKIGPLRNATAAWNFVVQHSLSDSSQKCIIAEYLSRQPRCKLLAISKWRQLMTTSFRLAVFLHNETNVKETYFRQLELTKDDSIKLFASLLMRLSVHITLNSKKEYFQYNQKMPTSSACPIYRSDEGQRVNANAFEYYSINATTDFVHCYNRLQESIESTLYSKSYKGNRLQQVKTQEIAPMSEYVSKLIISSIKNFDIKSVEDLLDLEAPTPKYIEQHFANLSTSKRCHLLSSIAGNYHKFIYDYFCYDGPRRQEKTALFATLKRFKHSCLANVEIRTSADGQYIGKTTMNIKAGTELTVCHESVDFFEQSRSERHAIFQEEGVICTCDVCSVPASMEPYIFRNGIFCAFCEENMEITQIPGSCSQCHAEYEVLLEQYTTFISYIVKEIRAKESDPKATQRELAILYGTYNSYLTMHFSEENSLRFAGVLSFVEFLTSNGFLNHASNVLIALHCSYYSYYVDNAKIYSKDIDATFFNQVRQIMERYVDNLTNSSEMDVVYPKKLLTIMLHILKCQEQYMDASIDDNEIYNTFLENYTLYYEWKKIINSYLLMPKSLQEYLKEA